MAAAPIDTVQLDALRASMSAEDFRTLLGLFAADLNDRLAALARAQGSLQRAQLTREAHQVVGAAANMGAGLLAAAARRLEDVAATAPPETINAAIAELATLTTEVLAELDQLAAAGP